jgi:C-terminal processing protease CtpA/Prc
MRRIRLFAIVVTLVIVASVMLFTRRGRPHTVRARPSLKEFAGALVDHPADFIESRISGGVGVLLVADPQTGLPVIEAVAVGSPADRAGLQKGDRILSVNGNPVTNTPLPQVADNMKGLTGLALTLAIQRGSTNYERVIHRSSRYRLRGLTYSPYE